MITTKETTTDVEQPVIKKHRRGVSNETKAVSQLTFNEKDSAGNGLFVAHLEDVTVTEKINADGKVFTGLSVPRLTFHFTSNHPNVQERRHAYYGLSPVESNVDTIPDGKDSWKVDNVLRGIKHLLDVFYLKGRELTEAEEDALSLPFEDFDEQGQYVPVDPEEVIAGYKQVFENAAAMMNGVWSKLNEGESPKPCYKNADGKFISCWIKLLRCRKQKGQWRNVGSNGELTFDNFIGNGFVELQKGNNPPTVLRLDLSRESITPKEVAKVPTVGMPQGSVIAPMMNDMGAISNEAYNEAVKDMPF